MAIVCPPATRLVLRAAPEFEPTLIETAPTPVPELPFVTLTQPAPGVAVQAQPLGETTEKFAVPPPK
jgi:hypothetical protein